jgi:hypothetical protein
MISRLSYAMRSRGIRVEYLVDGVRSFKCSVQLTEKRVKKRRNHWLSLNLDLDARAPL